LLKFDGTDWILYDASNSGLPGNFVTRIAIDQNETKWFGTWSYGYGIGEGLSAYNENGIPVVIEENILAVNKVKIYPNPAYDHLNFELQPNMNISYIEIINMQGNLVKRKKIAINQNTIDVRDLSCGIYIVRIHTDNGIATKRFIKQ
jgi:hypothetical protein